MKQLFTLLAVTLSCTAMGQTPVGEVNDSLDAGNIKAGLLGLGDMWMSPDGSSSQCEFPKGSGRTIAYAGNLWLAGYDNTGTLRVAAQTYRQDGSDFWPGPVTPVFDTALGYNWARIWKINQSEIDEFLGLSTHTLTNTPAAILEWPGKGNPYARGNGGVSLTVDRDMAPFVDVDGSGTYDPLAGDYPAIKGQQMLWSCFNDQSKPHYNTGGLPLGIFIRLSAYAYNSGTAWDNAVFYEYDIVNTSTTTYDSFRLGFFADLDVNVFNDFIGFDSTHRMMVAFSGLSADTTFAATGVSILQIPSDIPGVAPAPAVLGLFNNDFTPDGNPESVADYNEYIRGRNKSGVYKDWGGQLKLDMSLPNGGYAPCDSGLMGYDKRLVISTGNISLPTNQGKKLVVALLASEHAGACPNLDLTGLDSVADAIWGEEPTGIASLPATQSLDVYPNPANTVLYVTAALPGTAPEVINMLGQRFQPAYTRQGNKLQVDVSSLPKGLYTLLLIKNGKTQSRVFVKQ